jgi:hypothetical protein
MSGSEVFTELLLEVGSVLLENFVVLDQGKGLSVVRVSLVEEEVESDGAKCEVSDGELVSGDESLALESLRWRRPRRGPS